MNCEKGASPLTQLVLRSLDLFFSLTTLVALFPLLVLVAIALRFSGEGEVFYRQVRIGKNEREFRLLKFATMMKNSPSIGSGELTLPNDPRVLPMGRFLRKTKLNELPQLWNIVAGDISVIGPRPQTRRYFDCYRPEDKVWISKIRPGLSGVGSILFRDEESLLAMVADPVSFDDQVITPYKGKVEHWFAVNQSVFLYFELIITTLLVVLLPSAGLHRRLLGRVPPPPTALSAML
ncbi:sugar transferase [Paucibacter sp. AS339]|uniref:sugar transferase n=1 Tax=Paucibacter hankyongi TaxID=3133434 RepID=UPI0030B590F1